MTIREQAQYLKAADPVLGSVIDLVPVPSGRRRPDPFAALVEEIIRQQLSGKAADAISGRFRLLFKRKAFPDAKTILEMNDDVIRGAGISFQKISYIKNICAAVRDTSLDFQRIAKSRNEDVIAELTTIKGVGRWTAEMFLMFALEREDVFSYGDLGIRNAIQRLYRTRTHPSKQRAEAIAAKWRPYRTLACRYLWASHDLER